MKLNKLSQDILSGDATRVGAAVLKMYPLCYMFARRYSQNNRSVVDDLAQEGMIAVLEAIEEYNGSVQFNTFAYRKVQEKIQRTRPGFLRAVSISPEKYKEAQKYQELFEQVTVTEGKIPSFENICSRLGYNKLSQQGLRPLVSKDIDLDTTARKSGEARPDEIVANQEVLEVLGQKMANRLSESERDFVTEWSETPSAEIKQMAKKKGLTPTQLRNKISQLVGLLRD